MPIDFPLKICYNVYRTKERENPQIHKSPITNQCQPIDTKTEKGKSYDTERFFQRNRREHNP